MVRWFLNFFRMDKVFVPCKGRITSYGYIGDTTPDTNSMKGIGAWDNDLQDNYSLAVSRDIEALFKSNGVHPQDVVELKFEDGVTLKFRWDDRTAEFYNKKRLTGRFDIYSQRGESTLVDRVVVGFRKV